jgi:diguanylate cyclase (GGDEF)-like protein
MIKKDRSRFNIGLLMTASFDDYNLSIWKSIVKLAEINDVNLLCFPGGHLQSRPDISFNYQRNLVFDLVNTKKIDGIIVLSASLSQFITVDEMVKFLKRFSPLPIVSIGLHIKGIPSILIDNKNGIRELMVHLIEVHGFKRIAFLKGPENNVEVQERFQAYKEVLKEYNIPFDKKLILQKDFTYEAGKLAVIELIDKNKVSFDALVCCIDFMALSAIDELKERGIDVPAEIAVVGFDNITQGYYSIPPLTTVNQPTTKVGEEAFNTMLSILKKQKVPEKIVFPTQLVVRRSCNCLEYSFLNYSDIKITKKSVLALEKTKNEYLTKIQKNIESEYSWLKDIFKKPGWLAELINSLINKIVKRKKKEFLLIIEKIIIKGIENRIELKSKNNIVTIIFEILKRFVNNSDMVFFNALLKESYILLENIINRLMMVETINYEPQAFNLYEVSNIFISCYEFDKLKEMIVKKFSEMDINSCYVSLYENEQRAYAQLLVGYDKSKNIIISEGSKKFRSNMLVPYSINLDEKRHSFFILPLFLEDISLGFILFEINHTERAVYETIATQLSSALREVQLLDKIKKYSMELEEKVKERTIKLEEANKKLKTIDTLKNDFITNITHDFRSPLTAIFNITELELKSAKYDKESLKIIYTASLRLRNTIDKMLEIVRMDALGVKLKVRQVDPDMFLQKVLNFYTSSVIGSSIKIIKKFKDIKIDNFYTDVEKLEEIIDNIISNAIKFVDPDTGEISLDLMNKEESIIICIEDNGIGIVKEKLDIIFNRFERALGGMESMYRGTGIGLAFAKQLVGFLKGKIWAESEGEGKGSKFFIELKKGKNVFAKSDFVTDEKAKPAYQSKYFYDNIKEITQYEIKRKLEKNEITTYFNELNKENEYDYKKGVILIADDDKIIREIVMRYLVNYGYQNFIFVPNGKLALEAVYEYTPNLIICDYNMPNMKGDEFHNRLVNNPKFKEIPVIFLSAIVDRNIMVERKEKGACAYLKKPIDEKDLLLTVDFHIKKYLEYLKISQWATFDELTELNNRRAIINSLKHALAMRKYRDLALIFFDLDNFKDINDEFGHQTGDKMLTAIGKKIKSSVRSYDIAGRYGGDEFVVILLDTNLAQAAYVAEELRKAISNTKVVPDGFSNKQLSITSSFGVTSLKDNSGYIEKFLNIDSLENIYNIKDVSNVDWNRIEDYKLQISEILLKMADMSLYRAKQTTCQICNFTSEKSHVFINNKCPQCGSVDLATGRNRVINFA